MSETPSELHAGYVEYIVDTYKRIFTDAFVFEAQKGQIPGIEVDMTELRASLARIPDEQWMQMATRDPSGTGALLEQYRKIAT